MISMRYTVIYTTSSSTQSIMPIDEKIQLSRICNELHFLLPPLFTTHLYTQRKQRKTHLDCFQDEKINI